MCGRYAVIETQKLNDRFRTNSNLPLLKPTYNAAPGQELPVVVNQGNNALSLMKWGLVPFWAKDPAIGYKMINARSETLKDKPSFRKALISQRCLIPASGFYEWQKQGSTKIPFYIRIPNSPLFAMAGLYDIWKDTSGRELKTYTIITTEPNSLLAPIHNRMPVILEKEKEEIWLNPNQPDVNMLLSLLKPYPQKDMEAYPVSLLVNKPENNYQELIKPSEPLNLF